MKDVKIPNWNSNGALPPINSESPVSRDRSPYRASVFDFTMRFSTSPERREILKGYLLHRSRLHEIGILAGFQWLDGSFLENIEIIEQRNPNDLDVVTFFHSPENSDILDTKTDIFDNKKVKDDFKIDSYFIELDQLNKN